MALAHTLRFLMTHPLGRRRRLATLGRFVRWQLVSRLSPGPIAMPFAGDARLLVDHGMTGATGNLYVGLHEFADMAFVLHALRPVDLFLDVGANVGSYTILAAKVVGCACVSVEPIAATAARLRDNVALNGVADRVAIEVCAVGASAGSAWMTSRGDTVNRVVEAPSNGAAAGLVEVPCRTLDAIVAGRVPTLVKLDVEGREGAALDGASRLLRDPGLRACIVETLAEPGLAAAGESTPTRRLAALGFAAADYDPERRLLQPRLRAAAPGNNTLFVRDWDWARDRVRAAPPVAVAGVSL